MKNKLYFLITVITLGFALFTQGDFPRFLLGFEFLLWLALFVWARLLRQNLRCTMLSPADRVSRHTPIPLEVELENNSAFPVPEMRLRIQCVDEYSGDVRDFQSSAMLDSRETARLRWTIQAEHYGILRVCGRKFTVTDPLGVTRASGAFPKDSYRIAVLPRLDGEEDGIYAASGSGEDAAGLGKTDELGDTYELRTYREGEPLRNVHWKVTAKTGELMVREYEKQAANVLLVYLDLNTYGKPFTRSDYDVFLEAVAAFAAGQLEKDNPFVFVWHSGSADLCRMCVNSRHTALEALDALVREKPRSGETTHKENMEDEVCAAVCLNLWGQITGEQVPG